MTERSYRTTRPPSGVIDITGFSGYRVAKFRDADSWSVGTAAGLSDGDA
jgi:hypothetical protein